MNLKRSLTFALCFFISSICFAEMTIWLNNGNSLRAFKIVFQGETADIYLLDGSVRKMPVSQIDLKSSGIVKPEGTYGGKGTAPGRLPTVTPPLPVDHSARQVQLKEEWDRSDKQKAIAQRDVGPIRRGSVVRIVAQTMEQQQPTRPESPYYTKEIPPPPPKDNAYVILYQNPDGTFGKQLFDAATFAENFKMEEKPKPVVSLPIEPRIPAPSPSVQEPGPQPQVETTPPAAKDPEPASTEVSKKPEPAAPIPIVRDEKTSIAPILLALLGLAAIAAVVVLLSRKRKKSFLDISKFSQYEEELRDFEIEIWLKHGRTMDQLMDISVKKFYGDQPGPMAVAAKMLKGLDKNSLVPFISKQSDLDISSSERIYVEMKQRLDWIRSAIDSVAKRTGLAPQPEAAPAPTGIIPVPKAPASKPATVPPKPVPAAPKAPATAPKPAPPAAKQPAPVVPPPVAKPAPAPPRPAPAQPAQAIPGVPRYLSNVIKDLGLLTGPPQKFDS